MKRFLKGSVPAVAVAITAVGLMIVVGFGNTAIAAKPLDVIEWSNGFPSGEHFNLNIHGKKGDYFLTCDDSSGGGSVFVPEYGDSLIQYIQNKRSSLTELSVIDKCSSSSDDPAKVQLPKGEYQVYARILAKPSKNDEERSVIFYPKLIETCNDTGADDFGDAVDCEQSFLVGTGVITGNGVFDMDSQELTRAKGKSKAVEITDLFQWSGYACDQIFDTNGDGEITIDDLYTDANGDGVIDDFDADLNGDGVVDEADLSIYLLNNCVFYESEWVFNIADLVVYGWDYKNNGSKLLQVRFYPVATTEFTQ